MYTRSVKWCGVTSDRCVLTEDPRDEMKQKHKRAVKNHGIGGPTLQRRIETVTTAEMTRQV